MRKWSCDDSLLRRRRHAAGQQRPPCAAVARPFAAGRPTLAGRRAGGSAVQGRRPQHEAAQQIAAAWQAQIETAPYLALDRAYPDAVPFLQAVRQIPARTVLVSARQQPDALRATLQRCGLLAWTDDLLVVPPRQAARQKAAVLRECAQPGDVLVSGHTHVLKAEKAHINPGSISLPKEGNPKTYAVLEGRQVTIKTLDGAAFAQVKL